VFIDARSVLDRLVLNLPQLLITGLAVAMPRIDVLQFLRAEQLPTWSTRNLATDVSDWFDIELRDSHLA